MRTIGLVGCSKTKLPESMLNPEKEFPAGDMYLGRNYLRSVSEGLRHFNCEDYLILSGKYGLLEKTNPIKYYDCYLQKEKVKYRRAWSQNVYDSLCKKYGDLSDIRFVFFAGKAYYEFLMDKLNCVSLVFKGQNISFEVKEERSVQGE